MNAQVVSSLLGEEYIVRILSSTAERPVSIQSVCVEFNIPIFRAHHQVRLLVKLGLVERSHTVRTMDGRRLDFYVSSVNGAYVDIMSGRLKASFLQKSVPLARR